jgi:hypothetical protein
MGRALRLTNQQDAREASLAIVCQHRTSPTTPMQPLD